MYLGHRIGGLIGPVSVLLATVGASLWAFSWPTVSQDEFGLLVYPNLILHGRIPNRDFFTPYGPGTFWPISLVFLATESPSIAAIRGIGLAYHVLLALGVRAAVKHTNESLMNVAGCMAGLLSAGLLLIPYGWLIALGAVLWSMSQMERERFLFAGFAGGLACIIRPEFILVVLVTNGFRIRNSRCLFRFTLGLVIGTLPLAWHVIIVGPQLFTDAFLYRLLVNTRLGLPYRDPGMAAALLVLFAAVLFLCWLAARRRTNQVLSHAALAISLLPQVLQRTDREHVLFVAVAVVPLALAHLSLSAAARVPSTLARSLSYLPWAVAMTGLGFYTFAPHGQLASVNGHSLYVSSNRVAVHLQDSVSRIRSELRPGEDVFVGTEDMNLPSISPNYFYYLLPKRVPHSYFLELAPGVSERPGSGLLDDIRKADTLILSEFPAEQRHTLFPYLGAGSTRVDRYIESNFCMVERFSGYSVFPDVNFYRVCRANRYLQR